MALDSPFGNLAMRGWPIVGKGLGLDLLEQIGYMTDLVPGRTVQLSYLDERSA
jgi:hypothetical protein